MTFNSVETLKTVFLFFNLFSFFSAEMSFKCENYFKLKNRHKFHKIQATEPFQQHDSNPSPPTLRPWGGEGL